jgi:peptidoglycan L-alanyl-D-glutamate endopeptidase CwlK
MLLKEGSNGVEVKQLQQALKAAGFDPGGVDGDFGPNTTAAVRAFQQNRGLSVDGVAGQQTLDALGITFTGASAAPGGSVTAGVTPEIVSKMFPGTPVSHIQDNLPVVLKALDADTLGDKDMVLMALGTIRAETATFEPISEGVSPSNTTPGSHPFNRYDNRTDLGNQGPPDGANFRGRGFVQLTGRSNYTKFSAELGLGDQLVTKPALANDPEIAAKLLSRFLKDKESAIRHALANNDLPKARELVNGGQHGIDAFTSAFNTGRKLIG